MSSVPYPSNNQNALFFWSCEFPIKWEIARKYFPSLLKDDKLVGVFFYFLLISYQVYAHKQLPWTVHPVNRLTTKILSHDTRALRSRIKVTVLAHRCFCSAEESSPRIDFQYKLQARIYCFKRDVMIGCRHSSWDVVHDDRLPEKQILIALKMGIS